MLTLLIRDLSWPGSWPLSVCSDSIKEWDEGVEMLMDMLVDDK